jgi:hypothetical protein
MPRFTHSSTRCSSNDPLHYQIRSSVSKKKITARLAPHATLDYQPYQAQCTAVLSQSRCAAVSPARHDAHPLRVVALGCPPCQAQPLPPCHIAQPRRWFAAYAEPLCTSAIRLLPMANSIRRQASILLSGKEMLRCAENTCCKRMFQVF